jgi:hypothetical protein
MCDQVQIKKKKKLTLYYFYNKYIDFLCHLSYSITQLLYNNILIIIQLVTWLIDIFR